MKRCDACRNRSDRGVREARPGDDRDPLINSPTILQEEPYDNRTLSCGICTMFPSCISLVPRRSEPRAPRPGQVPVVLNVYDMYWTNWYTAGAGVGVFHSGVQVHGSEWAYGGHPYAFTGVFEITPRDERELGEQFRFRQSVHIGYTDFSEEEVRRLVTELGKQFRGDRYHLMNNNCNHFTSAFCLALCSRDIPAWVNRLAYVSSCVPFLQRCLPKCLRAVVTTYHQVDCMLVCYFSQGVADPRGAAAVPGGPLALRVARLALLALLPRAAAIAAGGPMQAQKRANCA